MRALILAVIFSAVAWGQSNSVAVKIGNQVNTTIGLHGRLQLAMSTSFQLAEWSYNFFGTTPHAPIPLTALSPFHTRVQVISKGVPLTAPSAWDFTELNAMFAAVQNTGDHSPELQIGTAPAFMSDANGHILPASFADFGQMSANLVRYYNTGGFSIGGQQYHSPLPYPVTW